MFSRVFLGSVLLDLVIQSQSEFVHRMYMPHVTIASNTKVKVLVREGREGVGREGRKGVREGGREEGREGGREGEREEGSE